MAAMQLYTRRKLSGFLFVAPFVFGFLAFTLIPVLYSIFISLSKYTMLKPPKFAGLVNYETALFGDPLFWKSLANTAYYTLLSVPLGLVGSLICALLLNQSIKARNLYRTLFYLPAITPIVATTLIWTFLLRSDFGLINVLLGMLGIQGPKWLGSIAWAKPSLVLISLWGVGGPTAMIFLAGLQGIDTELYEAAHIDGASAVQRFWIITLPMLSPTILFNSIIAIIQSFQAFDVAFIATEGGPANATLFYVLHLYRNAFEYFEVGYGAALAWLLFLAIFVLTLLQLRLSRRWVYYTSA